MNDLAPKSSQTKIKPPPPPFSQIIGGTFQATARLQDSDFFPKAIEMVWRCILSVIFHLLGFKLNLVSPMSNRQSPPAGEGWQEDSISLWYEVCAWVSSISRLIYHSVYSPSIIQEQFVEVLYASIGVAFFCQWIKKEKKTREKLLNKLTRYWCSLTIPLFPDSCNLLLKTLNSVVNCDTLNKGNWNTHTRVTEKKKKLWSLFRFKGHWMHTNIFPPTKKPTKPPPTSDCFSFQNHWMNGKKQQPFITFLNS